MLSALVKQKIQYLDGAIQLPPPNISSRYFLGTSRHEGARPVGLRKTGMVLTNKAEAELRGWVLINNFLRASGLQG